MSDLIDRQAAIDAVYKCTDIYITNLPVLVDKAEAYKALAEVPSTQTERKTGRWKKISPAGIYECSECGRNVMTADIEAYEFCHGCGAKMKEGDSE